MKPQDTQIDIEKIGKILMDTKVDLAARFRALFTLKNVAGEAAIKWISQALVSDQSALLKHECAFCLGQMQDPLANDVLKSVLETKNEHPMVRHEAGEALAAIGSSESLDILKKYSQDEVLEVAQTCQLGVQKMESDLKNGSKGSEKGSNVINYSSVDPTPAFGGDVLTGGQLVDYCRDQLLNGSDLYQKYQSLFTLRNLGTEEAVKIMGEALLKYQNDGKNNLLKHEIAFVFGQMQHVSSVPYLKQVLMDTNENEMVRHEAAEALGSVASEEAAQVLQQFKGDNVQVVRESIQVALDMSEYEKSQEQFNFIDK